MKFTKMQAMGNDYIYIELLTQTMEHPDKWARFVADRHFGVGADGMILICPSDKADFRMRVFNPDGTEAEMCGNALRSVSMYVYEKGFTQRDTVTVETLGGIKTAYLDVRGGHVVNITANVGMPLLESEQIPVNNGQQRCIDYPVVAAGREFYITAVSMGNPHCVAFVDDVAGFDLGLYGPAMECCPLFPEKTNAEFTQIVDRKTVMMRTWERGTGETLACATGCCATLTAGILNDLTDRKITVHQRGGDIVSEMNGSGELFMTAPSFFVCDGEISGELPDMHGLKF